MQLNNKSTGKIVKYVNSDNSGIAYDIFDNYFALQNQKGKRDSTTQIRDKSFIPDVPMCENELLELTTYNKLLSLPEFSGYELSTDEKNWFDQTRPFRLISDSEEVYTNITEYTELAQLLLSLLSDFAGQIKKAGNETHIYLATLTEYKGVDANQLIAAYPETFLRIENK